MAESWGSRPPDQGRGGGWRQRGQEVSLRAGPGAEGARDLLGDGPVARSGGSPPPASVPPRRSQMLTAERAGSSGLRGA